MATTPVPGLRSLFEALSIGLDDAIFICEGQDVSQVLDAAKETATDWEDDALTAELQKECPAVLKELKKEKKEEEKAAAAEEKKKEKEKQDEEKKKAAAKKDEEKKKKDEEDKKKKAAADKKKAEEKKKQDEEKKRKDEENKKKKAIADKKKAEEKKKKDEEDKKKKEEEKKKKAVADKKKAEEKKKKDEEDKKKKAAADKKKAQEKRKKDAEKTKKEAEKKKKKEEEKKRKEEKKQTDLEARGIPGGQYNARERPFSKTVTDDPCCACAKGCADCCKAFSFIFMFLLYPGIYALMIYGEYSTYGFERFLARANGGGFNVTDDDMNGVAAVAPAPAKGGKAGAGDESAEGGGGDDDAPAVTLEDNPLVWILPLLGVGHGLFTNMVPISGSLILMPLFQSLEVTKSSGATLALCSLIQSVSNGLLGWTMWMARDPRFLVCRALFLLVPCGWIGYLVGVTSHLSLKDVLLAINESIDDDYEGATHSMRETIDEADIALLHCYLRIALGCFMLMMSVFVLIGVCAGGMARFCCCQTITGGSIKGCRGCCSWLIAMYCSLSTGYLFVATIGAGMACTTYFILAMFLGIETKRAMPTAIIIGGWTAWVPTIMNYVVLEGAAGYVRFLMMFPGLWFGAVFSPWFSRCGGPTCDMFWYFLCLVAVGTTVVCMSAIAIQNDEEDIDINIKPMIYLDSIEAAFDATGAPAASPTIAPVVKAAAAAAAGGKGGKGGAMW